MAEQVFKTIYFPANRTQTGRPSRVTVSMPAAALGDLRGFLQTATSRELRAALGDPHLEDLERQATSGRRSLSNTVLQLLLEAKPAREVIGTPNKNGQLTFAFNSPTSNQTQPAGDRALGVTFQETKRNPVHRWYPYVEGFSASYVQDVLLRGGTRPQSVYDPFGGAGTTMLAASIMGIPSHYSEINPFMSFVADTKLRCAAWARHHLDDFCAIAEDFCLELSAPSFRSRAKRTDPEVIERAFPGRDFFEAPHLRDLLAARELADEVGVQSPEAGQLLLLTCAANAVKSSNMTRRADLRRRRADEYRTRDVNVAAFLRRSIQEVVDDIATLPESMADATFISSDCRSLPDDATETFDLAMTSPPYLNGTNYFRNTKLELWLLRFLNHESELTGFRRQTICAGINDVGKDRPEPRKFDGAERVARQLDKCAKDRRIPKLVRHYVSDMYDMFCAVHRGLKPGKSFVLDIGDSRFYGVHVPTDSLLVEVATAAGFQLNARNVLARRRSRDSSELCQAELVFEKPKESEPPLPLIQLKTRTSDLASNLPYRTPPFSSRMWGHPLHRLCSYQGKFKPSLAHWLVRLYVPEGARVLDPLGGVGTLALEASLSGRPAVTNDKSPLASTIAAAKVRPPDLGTAEDALLAISSRMSSVTLKSEDFEAANFGLNGRVLDFYHPDTLEEVLRARRVFAESPGDQPADCFIWASILHVLHGNRPYALSRTSHPVTPFNPSGPFIYKSLVEKTRERIARALKSPLPAEHVPGVSHHGDFRELTALYSDDFDAVITSPPFMGMRFDRPNWLRLWFCGWGETDFHKQSLGFLERQQTKSMDCYDDFYAAMAEVMRRGAALIVHLGSGGRDKMLTELTERGSRVFEYVDRVDEDVSVLEKHGLADKGMTSSHHLLVFRKR